MSPACQPFPQSALQNLLKLYERQEGAVADLRHKLKQARGDMNEKAKQLDLAHRTIERMAVSKSGLEATSAAEKAYMRQLESRLLALKGASELDQRCAQLKSEVDGLRAQLVACEQRCHSAEEDARQQRTDGELLRRGIELAAEQLTRSAGADVSSTVLMAVAQVHNLHNLFALLVGVFTLQ